jgi:hypothetical protein
VTARPEEIEAALDRILDIFTKCRPRRHLGHLSMADRKGRVASEEVNWRRTSKFGLQSGNYHFCHYQFQIEFSWDFEFIMW